MINVGIADDEPLFREGLEKIVRSFVGIDVIIVAASGKELVEQLASAPLLPNVLLLDLRMKEMNGVELMEVLNEDYIDIPVIILSTYFSEVFVRHMIQLGVSAYLPKSVESNELERAIRRTVAYGFYFGEEVRKMLRTDTGGGSGAVLSFDQPVNLTDREIEVIRLICDQLTNKEIADRLFISTRTADRHRENILQKLEVKNTAGIVLKAISLGIISEVKLRLNQG